MQLASIESGYHQLNKLPKIPYNTFQHVCTNSFIITELTRLIFIIYLIRKFDIQQSKKITQFIFYLTYEDNQFVN